MNKQTAQLTKHTSLLIVGMLICFILLFLLRVLPLTKGIDYGLDVYYHIKAGEMFPFFATSKVFPWAEMSIWKTNFYDKELGFHFIIFILLKIQRFFGFSSEAPFNFISLFFSGLFILLFSTWGWMKCNKTSFLIAPLLIFISPEFFQKLITIRPYLISIILYSLVIFLLLSDISFKKKSVLIFILGWTYSLCYSVPYIILFPLILLLLVYAFINRTYNFLSALYLIIFGFMGVIIGLTLHPQFPNTFLISYIQLSAVILKTLGLSSSSAVMATELNPPTFHDLLRSAPVFIIFTFNLLIFLKHKQKTEKDIFLFTLNCILIAGFFLSKRTTEYLIPTETICFVYFTANIIKPENNTASQKMFLNTKKLILLALLLILIILPINRFQIKRLLKLPIPCYAFGKWQKTNLKKGAYIGLLNWGDFPRIFYVASDLKYSMALDPMFSYCIYPKRTDLISDFMIGKNQKITPSELAAAFGTNLVYIPNYYIAAAYYLLSKGSKFLYQDKQGCLVELQIN